ncbi:MAG: hypothetical protein FWD76_00635 [Firmicutes bacterium]|nr:hypothetical protein [Bacillota bacterium]
MLWGCERDAKNTGAENLGRGRILSTKIVAVVLFCPLQSIAETCTQIRIFETQDRLQSVLMGGVGL